MGDEYPLHIINANENVVRPYETFINLGVLKDEYFLPQHFILRIIRINKQSFVAQ
jgi:hypothetical protein